MTRVFNCLEDQWAAEGVERRAAPPTPPPSLSKESQFNNERPESVNKLTGSHRKSAEVIEQEVKGLAVVYGIERVGMLTLTFPYHVRDLKEARRRFNSLLTNVVKKRYVCGLTVVERHRRGGIHFHLVAVLHQDIRSGVDFEAFERRDYRSAGPALRAEWAFLRTTLKRYGFGRHELLPVKSTAEGISKYVGKYINKHITLREPRDVGARLVTYFNYKPGQRRASPHFAWAKGSALLWRLKLGTWAPRKGMKDLDEIRKICGPRWAFHRQGEIMNEVLSIASACKFEAAMQGQTKVATLPSESRQRTERTEKDSSGADHPRRFLGLSTTQGGFVVPVGFQAPPVFFGALLERRASLRKAEGQHSGP